MATTIPVLWRISKLSTGGLTLSSTDVRLTITMRDDSSRAEGTWQLEVPKSALDTPASLANALIANMPAEFLPTDLTIPTA